MYDMIELSVITVVYNNFLQIEETISNVLENIGNRKDIEYIVIDGGSTDGTVDIIKKYEDVIHISVSEKDKGIYDAMNKGVSLASGKWVNFMNAGDRFVSSEFKKVLNSFADIDADVIFGDVLISKTNSDPFLDSARPIAELNYSLNFCHQSSFVKGDYLKEFPFDIQYKICADYDFFLKCAIRGKTFKYIPVPVSIFQYGGVSTGLSKTYFKEKAFIIIRNHLTFNNKMRFLFKFLKMLIPINRKLVTSLFKN